MQRRLIIFGINVSRHKKCLALNGVKPGTTLWFHGFLQVFLIFPQRYAKVKCVPDHEHRQEQSRDFTHRKGIICVNTRRHADPICNRKHSTRYLDSISKRCPCQCCSRSRSSFCHLIRNRLCYNTVECNRNRLKRACSIHNWMGLSSNDRIRPIRGAAGQVWYRFSLTLLTDMCDYSTSSLE